VFEATIAPGLLVAMPQLLDPNFRRSVVLMVEHGSDGSLGLIVNRPGPLLLTALLEHLEAPWGGDPDATVGVGGPVMAGSGWLLHEPIADLEPGSSGTVLAAPGIVLTTSEDTIRRVAERPPTRTMLLLGYAGWESGQLESELETGSWLHAEATPELVFDVAAPDMWEAAVRSIGVDPAVLVPSEGVN